MNFKKITDTSFNNEYFMSITFYEVFTLIPQLAGEALSQNSIDCYCVKEHFSKYIADKFQLTCVFLSKVIASNNCFGGIY